MEREERTADKAGPKMIQVSLALATRLLETVADMAKDMRDESTTAIQYTSLLLVGESFYRFLEFLSHQATRRDSRQTNGPYEPEINPRDNPSPRPLAGDTPQSAPRPE